MTAFVLPERMAHPAAESVQAAQIS